MKKLPISSWTAKDAKLDDVTLYELTEHVLAENTNKIEETLNKALLTYRIAFKGKKCVVRQ